MACLLPLSSFYSAGNVFLPGPLKLHIAVVTRYRVSNCIFSVAIIHGCVREKKNIALLRVPRSSRPRRGIIVGCNHVADFFCTQTFAKSLVVGPSFYRRVVRRREKRRDVRV